VNALDVVEEDREAVVVLVILMAIVMNGLHLTMGIANVIHVKNNNLS
jgi:hypothetical protein